jgi:hypothetical protein
MGAALTPHEKLTFIIWPADIFDRWVANTPKEMQYHDVAASAAAPDIENRVVKGRVVIRGESN